MTQLTCEMLERLGFKSEGEGDKRTWWLPGTTFTLFRQSDGTIVAPVCGCMVPVRYDDELNMLMKLTGTIHT